jgi:hypothetical protein
MSQEAWGEAWSCAVAASKGEVHAFGRVRRGFMIAVEMEVGISLACSSQSLSCRTLYRRPILQLNRLVW